MEEDKQKICDALAVALKQTRLLSTLNKLVYSKEKDEEVLTAVYNNGYTKKINVTCDSGTAMIRDIMKAIA